VVNSGDKGVRVRWLGGFPQIGDRLYTSPPAQRKPLPKGEWPKHPSPYVDDQYIGYAKSDLDDYATQVLAAHGIKE
jgi:hypothetical protein